MISNTNHYSQGSGEQGSVLMKFISSRMDICSKIICSMVDGHPIHNKDPKIMVIINPYEPLDD